MFENTVAVAGGAGRTDAPELAPIDVPDVVVEAVLGAAFSLELAPQLAKYIDDANIMPVATFRTTALLNRTSWGVL